MKVVYTAALGDSSGYAEAARNYVAAMHTNGIQVGTRSLTFENWKTDTGPMGELCRSLEGKYSDASKQIIHATPNLFSRLRDPNKYNIGMTVWETSRLPESWVPEVNSMDEIWVPCIWNKIVFEQSGVTKPIKVLPHCFKLPSTSDKMIIDNVSERDFVFYSIFQWTERKNPFGLLKAYLTEFKAEDPVVLVLKTYIINPSSTLEADRLRSMIREFKASLHLKTTPRIVLISHSLSNNQIAALHQRGNCFVSLHRAEGFGMPIAEAMAFAKPVVTTGYGGPPDFIEHEKTGLLVKCVETPVSGMPWENYTGDQLWAEPFIMDARRHMRAVYENTWPWMGDMARNSIDKNLSHEKIATQIKEFL